MTLRKEITIKYPFNLQSAMLQISNLYITETPNLPEHIKPNVRQILSAHRTAIGLELGALELIWRREREV